MAISKIHFPFNNFEWNKFNPNIQISDSIGIFKRSILTLIRVVANNIFIFHNPKNLKLLSRLHLGLSHFHEHKFKYSFQDCLNPVNICGIGEIEACCYYVLHCSNYSTETLFILLFYKKKRNEHNSSFIFWR